uniref:Uncharacterized protein n=1 Tax=Monodelphis domestica TaxID=13616 RepID=A0A5F8GJ97_MONDO
MEIDVFHWHLLVASGSGGLQCIVGPGLGGGGAGNRVPHDGRHLPLPIVNALTQGAAIHAELQALGHADCQRQVATQLPHIHGGPYIPGVHLHMEATCLLDNVQALDVTISATGGAIDEGCRQVIGHGLVHFLIGTLMVGFEDNSYLWKIGRQRRKRNVFPIPAKSSAFPLLIIFN